MCLGLYVSHLILGWFVDNRVGGLSDRGDPGLVIPAYGLYLLLMYAAMVPGNWVSRQMETKISKLSIPPLRPWVVCCLTALVVGAFGVHGRAARGGIHNLIAGYHRPFIP